MTELSEETARDTPLDNQSDLLKGAAANLSGFIVRLGARLPFLFVVALLYGTEIFGQYLFAVTIVETCTTFILFGFNRSLFHFLHEDTTRDDMADIYNTTLTALVICIGIGMAILTPVYLWQDVLLQFFPDQMAKAVITILPAAILYALSEILLTATRAARKMRYEVTAKSIIEPYILVIFSTGFFFSGLVNSGLFIAYWIMNISILAYAIYAFSRVYEKKNRVWQGLSRGKMKSMIRFSAPTAAYDLINVLTQRTDIYILAAVVTPASLGIYGIILQIITIVKKIRQSFDPILQPVISQTLKQSHLQAASRELARVSYWILSVQALIFTLLIFYALPLLGLFNITDDSAAMTLLILIGAVIIQGSLGLSELVFLYKKPLINPVLSLFILPLHAGLCYFMIITFGITGAALSLLISYTITEIMRLSLIKYYFNIFPLGASLLKPLFSSLLLFWYLSLIISYIKLNSALGLVIGIIGGIFIYALSFLVTAKREEKDILLKKTGLKRTTL